MKTQKNAPHTVKEPREYKGKVLVYCGINNLDNFRVLRPYFEKCHGFDANPRKIESAKQMYAADPDVRIVFGALSDKGNETVDFHITDDWDPSSTLGVFNPEFGDFKNGLLASQTTIKVPTINLYDYCVANNIDSIDLLILDLQGMDLAILKTMEPFIRESRIACIQAETEKDDCPHTYVNLPSNKLRDFKALLSGNYEIVKISPDTVPDEWWEMDIAWQRKSSHTGQRSPLQRNYVINIVYQHLQNQHARAAHRGPFNVIFTPEPIAGCELYKYLNANSFCGRQQGIHALLLFEPAVVLPGQYNQDIWEHFDHILTPFDAFVGTDQRFTRVFSPRSDWIVPVGSTEDQAEREIKYPLSTRKNAICMINGFKSSSMPGELYSKRVDAAEWFCRHSDIPFDVFGKPAFDLPNYKGTLGESEKFPTLAGYKYCLCFENVYHETFSSGYISEKILDCLETRTIPIYLGAYNIENYIPSNCFIDFRTFGDFAELDTYLHRITEEEYRQYINSLDEWVTAGGLRAYSAKRIFDKLCYLVAGGRSLPEDTLFSSAPDWEDGLGSDIADRTFTKMTGKHYWSWATLAGMHSRFFMPDDEMRSQEASIEHAGKCESAGKYNEAMNALRSAIDAGPVASGVYYRCAQLCIAAKKFDEAREMLAKVLVLNPSHSTAHDDLGVLYSQTGDHKKAMECFVMAHALDNGNYNALRNIMALSSQLGLVEQAQYFLKAAIGRRPEDAKLLEIAREFATANTARPVSGALALTSAKNPAFSLSDGFLHMMAGITRAAIFVETGTFMGGTTAEAAAVFREVHSIELSKQLFEKACERFRSNDHVHLYQGDSSEVIPQILAGIGKGPYLFWLDGHYSAGPTAKGKHNTPVIDEVRAIRDSGLKDAFLLVDDIRLFQESSRELPADSPVQGYPSLEYLCSEILAIDPGYQFAVIGDIAFAYPPGSGITVSPVVSACTVSRLYNGKNYSIDEVLAAEKTIAQAHDDELLVIQNVLPVLSSKDDNGAGGHYRLWYGLTLSGEGRYTEALAQYGAAGESGFGHWRLAWYRARDLAAAGKFDDARKAMGVLFENNPCLKEVAGLYNDLAHGGGEEPGDIKPYSEKMIGRNETVLEAIDRLGLKKAPLRLHLGCGEQRLDGYVNIDYPPDEHNIMNIKADLFANIADLKCPDAVLDEVRLHHVFEHFNRVTALAMIIKWHQWLRTGGTLYIETPDIAACSRTFLGDASWKAKMGLIRHLTGDQTAHWGYHIDQWFPACFEHTLKKMGFADVTTRSVAWRDEPYLANVHAVGIKTKNLPIAELLQAADEILWESTVADAERPMFEMWRRQLREALQVADMSAVSREAGPDEVSLRSYSDLYLGIKFYGHNSAVFAIFPQDEDCYGMQSERLTRYKHDNLFPLPAIANMISYKRIDPLSVKRVYVGSAFTSQKSEKYPLKMYELSLAWRKLLDAKYVRDFEEKLAAFRNMPGEQQEVLLTGSEQGKEIIECQAASANIMQDLDTTFRSYLGKIFPNAEIRMSYHDHEYCHAISSYYSSDFTEALLVAFDGWGDENAFSRIYLARNGEITEIGSSISPIRLLRLSKKNPRMVHECSIGGIYTYFTQLLGFRPESDEGKVEALAAYGNWDNSIYRELMGLVKVSEANGIEIDYNRATELLDLDRMTEIVKNSRKEDLAAAVQKFAEEIVIRYIKIYTDKTGVRSLCLSGGVFANVIINLRIFKEISDRIFIVPAMADDGSAQGAAILELIDAGVNFDSLKWLQKKTMPYFGSAHSRPDVLRCLERTGMYVSYEDLGDNWPEAAAEFVANGKIGAIYHGRMEWGPRALGNRSIIADARIPDVQDILNRDIKNRPYFQPFCPSMLDEEMDRLFDKAYPNKHMTIAFDMKKEFWDKLPGAIHIDGTSRVQFVSSQDNEHYYRLIKRVKELTGFGVIINTSFNKHGRTIVESPNDALQDFLDSNMDYLVMEGYLVTKNRQAKTESPQAASLAERKEGKLVAIIFSKDRAMQLDAAVRSFFRHCSDSPSVELKVLYAASDAVNRQQYEELKRVYSSVTFINEQDFKQDLLSMMRPSQYILFLVDDNIFVRDFSIRDIISSLYANDSALGFSLRLGRNTGYCYMLDKRQAMPDFRRVLADTLIYEWVGAEYDFGYPLEVSSSVYRASDMVPLFEKLDFGNPNTLELAMDSSKTLFSATRKDLLCFQQSAAFCNPVNTVQKMWKNRSGERGRYSLEALTQLFHDGYRINIEKFAGFVPGSCHQEVEMDFEAQNPLITIIILNYNGLSDIRPCIESIARNTPEPHRIVVFDNASTDGSVEYLRGLKDIVLVQNPDNIGCPAGRARAMSYIDPASKYVVFLDNDTIVTNDWASRFIAHCTADPLIGMLGPRSNYVSGQQFVKDASYGDIGQLESFAREWSAKNKGMLTPTHRLVGFCMFITRDVIDKLGSIDPSFGKFGFEDDDYTWRTLVAGYKTMIANDVFIHHKGGPQGQGNAEYNRLLSDAWQIFKTKWGLPADLGYGASFNIGPVLTQSFASEKHYIPIPGIMRGHGSRDASAEDRYSEIVYLAESEQYQEAIAGLEQLANSYPDNALYHNDLGVLYYKTGDAGRSLANYQKACGLDDTNETFLRNLADLYMVELKDVEAALECYLKVMKLNPKDTEVLSVLGNICMSRGQHTDARFFYRKVLEADKGNAGALEVMKTFADLEEKGLIAPEEKYFAQYQQDEFLDLHVFKRKERGVFLDIGAADGVFLSNTYFFETFRKWDGICIEPNPVVFGQLTKNRRCTTLNAAVSEKAGKARFLKVDGYAEMLSGLVDYYEKDHLARIDREIKEYGGSKTEIEVDTFNINDLLSQHGIRHIDYCNIDVEGAEFEILKTIDFDTVQIDVLTVENNYGSAEMREFMASRNYRLIAKLGCDDVFQRDTADKGTGIPRHPSPGAAAPEAAALCTDNGTACAADQMGTTVIMALPDKPKHLKDCLQSILENTEGDTEFVFVAKTFGKKTEGLIKQALYKKSGYRLIHDKNGAGYTGLINQAIIESSMEYIVLLDPSTWVTRGWLSGMRDCLNHAPDAGIVGPMTNRSSQAGQVLKTDIDRKDEIAKLAAVFRERNAHRRFNVFRLSGFCMLAKKRSIIRIGLLDPSFDYFSMPWNIDLSIKCSLAGFRNVVAADVYVHRYSHDGKHDSALLLNKWKHADTATSKKVTVLAALERSQLAYERGKLKEAVDVLIDCIKSAPDDTDIYLELARMLMDSREYNEALDALQTIADHDKEHLRVLESLGYTLEALDRDTEGMMYAERLLSLKPGHPAALNLMGLFAYKNGKVREAENLFAAALKNDPGYSEPYRNLGLMKWTAGSKEEGLDLLEKAFILAPKCTDNGIAYLSAVIDRQVYGRAESALKEAISTYPDNRGTALFLIDLYIRQEKTGEAMEETLRCLAHFGPDDDLISIGLEARRGLGAAVIGPNGTGKGTLSVCMIAKNEEKNLARCLASIAPIADEIIIVDTGSEDRTKDMAVIFGAQVFDFPWTNDFSEARNVSLSHARGQWILVHDADEVISKRDYATLRGIIRKDPKHPVAYSLVTRNYTTNSSLEGWTLNTGEYPDEESGVGWVPTPKVRLLVNDSRFRFENPVHEMLEPSLWRENVEILPCSVPIHHYGKLDDKKLLEKANMYYVLGRKKLLASEHMNLGALRELAVQASELKRYEEAIVLWEQYLALDPSNHKAHFNISTCYFETGQCEKALAAARRSLEIDPSSKEAILGYASVSLCVGDIEETISLIENLFRTMPEYPPARVALAAAYFIKGIKEKAREHMRILSTNNYRYAIALHSLTEKLIAAGRFEYALSVLDMMDESGNAHEASPGLRAECRTRLASACGA